SAELWSIRSPIPSYLRAGAIVGQGFRGFVRKSRGVGLPWRDVESRGTRPSSISGAEGFDPEEASPTPSGVRALLEPGGAAGGFKAASGPVSLRELSRARAL